MNSNKILFDLIFKKMNETIKLKITKIKLSIITNKPHK